MHLSRHLRTPSRAAVAGLAVVGVLVAAGCGSVGYQDGAGTSTTNGKTLFTQKCGSCHVLQDAGTSGTIGPNLDASFFQFRAEMDSSDDAEDTIRQVVRGQIAYPTTDPATNAPGMPKDIVKGQDADDVAAYVASVAGVGDTADTTGGGGTPAPGGETPAPAPGDSGSGDSGSADGGATGGSDEALAAGKDVFTANCAGCHTLADAGAAGTVGPNLDQAKPTKELALDRLNNGKGAMPKFKGLISDDQIEQVATYVSTVAGS